MHLMYLMRYISLFWWHGLAWLFLMHIMAFTGKHWNIWWITSARNSAWRSCFSWGSLCLCTCRLVELGSMYFISMKEQYCIQPNWAHYACVIWSSSESWWLNDAYNLLERKPVGTNGDVLGSFVGACREHGTLVWQNRLYMSFSIWNQTSLSIMHLYPTCTHR
jgi:hypothetical protein